MKYPLISFLFSLFTLVQVSGQAYLRLHQKAIVIDTHNDILNACFEQHYSFDQNLKGKTHSDINRFREGGIDVQIFSIWCDGLKANPYKYANEQIDTLYATALRNPDKIRIVKSTT